MGLDCGHLRPGEFRNIADCPAEGMDEDDRQTLLLGQLGKSLAESRFNPRLLPLLSNEQRWFLVLSGAGSVRPGTSTRLGS